MKIFIFAASHQGLHFLFCQCTFYRFSSNYVEYVVPDEKAQMHILYLELNNLQWKLIKAESNVSLHILWGV